MRLVCPNCEAKYEVPDDAIPEGGRDVQCSSCGHAWFQGRPEIEAAVEEEAALYGDNLPAAEGHAADTAIATPEAAATAAPEAWPEAADEAKPDLEPTEEEHWPEAPAAGAEEAVATEAPAGVSAVPETAAPEGTDDALAALLGQDGGDDASSPDPAPEASAPPAATPPRQDLDDDVLAILREEAQREEEARRNEARRAEDRRAEAEGQMQVQPDLGVEAAAPAAALTPTQRRLAMLKGKDPDAPPPEPARPAARRDLLPDVEEINSTLQPSDGGADPDAEIDALPDLTRSRSSFRNGFFLMFLLLIIAAAIYMAAPKLIEQFPSMEGTLTNYVANVDSLRLWLNEMMNSATAWLNGSEG